MMRLIRFENVTEFVRHVEPFLVKREAENNLLLGLIPLALNYSSTPYMVCVEDGGEVAAVALRTPPRGLILSTTDETASLELIAQDVYALFGSVPDASGPKAVASSFANYWQACSGQTYKLDMQMGNYSLQQVRPAANVRGEGRRATEQDRDLLVTWFYDFEAEAFGKADKADAEEAINRWFNTPSSTILLWVDEGKAVSMAGSSRPTPHGIRIGPVYTPPEYRGRGYASACVAALSQQMLDAGYQYCFLYTDLSNPTSNRIYQNIGYEPVCNIDHYRFEDKGHNGH
jgi:predicted GNAT family acetyltransferase